MESNYRYIQKNHPDYPTRLQHFSRMPIGLFVKGSLPDPSRKMVAIVGSRSCSAYGQQVAQNFARVLSSNGINIISGLAFGIDTWAHKGCIEGGSPTYAVMGCGIDICYPKSNYPLYRKILSTGGGIISEYEPKTPALPHHFPTRNRIISALSDALIVIEARVKSGSLITANYALEQGIQVYAVPGRISDSLSAGTNSLILQGAIPALSPEDVLLDLSSFSALSRHSPSSQVSSDFVSLPRIKKEETPSPPQTANLSADELLLLSCIGPEPSYADAICSQSGLGFLQVSSLLLSLEMKGCIFQPLPGLYATTNR